MTERILRDALGRPIVPLKPGAEPFRDAIEGRRQRLLEHNPSAINWAANILKARSKRANGDTPLIRCDEADHEARYRRYQLAGAKPYRVEDGTAVFLENELGQNVELDAVREFLLTAAAIAPEKIRALMAELAGVVGATGPVVADERAALAEFELASADLSATVITEGPVEDREAKARRVVEATRKLVGPRIEMWRREKGGAR